MTVDGILLLLQPGGSDHQRFYEYGFPAAQVYERVGLIKDPMYHNTGSCLSFSSRAVVKVCVRADKIIVGQAM